MRKQIKLELTSEDLAMTPEELAAHVRQQRAAYIAGDLAMLAIANLLINKLPNRNRYH